MTITVMQVFKALGVQPDPKVSWSVGSRIAAAYAEEYGKQPPKENRPKTSGGGSHCFAIYPATWRRKIEKAIKDVVAFQRSQGDMFGEPK